MDIVIKLDFDNLQIQRVNQVRMFPGFFYISEICNAEGTAIAQGTFHHQKDQDEYKTKMRRPHIPNPNKTSWKLWDRFITNITTDGINLKSLLSEWTDWHIKSGNWTTHISPDQGLSTRGKGAANGTNLSASDQSVTPTSSLNY